jgi:hypothetical protein
LYCITFCFFFIFFHNLIFFFFCKKRRIHRISFFAKKKRPDFFAKKNAVKNAFKNVKKTQVVRKKETFTQSLHDMLQLWLEMLDLNDEKSNI